MDADAADQRAMASCARTTIIVLAAATNKLLFISGFGVFSGFSGLSISNLSEIPHDHWVRRELLGLGHSLGRRNR
jgi:hypothetical protein